MTVFYFGGGEGNIIGLTLSHGIYIRPPSYDEIGSRKYIHKEVFHSSSRCLYLSSEGEREVHEKKSFGVDLENTDG